MNLRSVYPPVTDPNRYEGASIVSEASISGTVRGPEVLAQFVRNIENAPDFGVLFQNASRTSDDEELFSYNLTVGGFVGVSDEVLAPHPAPARHRDHPGRADDRRRRPLVLLHVPAGRKTASRPSRPRSSASTSTSGAVRDARRNLPELRLAVALLEEERRVFLSQLPT
jgi:hypothetical protein